MKRRILVTCALPYANGPIHLGHMLEHIQADIWVRFMRMNGHETYFVCADDAHGTPIMLKAASLGITPEQLIEQTQKSHQADFNGFNISFDNYHSTHSPENKELVSLIYDRLDEAGYIKNRAISQLYDTEKNMFLPDRFVKGTCPKCKSPDQYGDNCEVCASTYSPTDLINPYSAVSGSTPELRDSLHFFFDLPHFEEMLKQWTRSGSLQEEIANKLQEWFSSGLKQWDISRDAPYFGFEIPRQKDKFFYVWLDAPIGYMASFKNYCNKNTAVDFDQFWEKGSTAELYHFIGKDITYFHSLFWPAMLQGAGFRLPNNIFVHGYVTVNGEKMSKSRGTFIQAQTYLKQLDPECLRYYYASKLSEKIDDLDLNLTDFVAKVNTDIVNKVVNLASRCAGFISKKFAGKLSSELDDSELFAEFSQGVDVVAGYYQKRQYNKAVREIMHLSDLANKYIDTKAPWVMAKDDSQALQLQAVCTQGIALFSVLAGMLKPIMPQLVAKAEHFLNLELTWDKLKTPLLNHNINPFKPIFKRIELAEIDKLIEAAKIDNQALSDQSLSASNNANNSDDHEPIGTQIEITDWAKLDLRLAKIIAAKEVENSNKMIELTIDLGFEKRTIFSGIKGMYSIDALVGKTTVIIANLKPRKMKFGVSEGMLLSAENDGKIFLLNADEGAKLGSKLY